VKVLSLIGQRYGQLQVTREVESTKYSRWECQCDCGETVIVTSKAIRHDGKVHCGGAAHRTEVGKRYGKLTVIGLGKPIMGRKSYECRCDCGNEGTYIARTVTKGNRRSCGCGNEKVTVKPKMVFYGSEPCLLASMW
jgi:hypothetical protein